MRPPLWCEVAAPRAPRPPYRAESGCEERAGEPGSRMRRPVAAAMVWKRPDALGVAGVRGVGGGRGLREEPGWLDGMYAAFSVECALAKASLPPWRTTCLQARWHTRHTQDGRRNRKVFAQAQCRAGAKSKAHKALNHIHTGAGASAHGMWPGRAAGESAGANGALPPPCRGLVDVLPRPLLL